MPEIISKEVLQAYKDCDNHSCNGCKAEELCDYGTIYVNKILVDTALHLYEQLDSLPADFISSLHNGVAEQLAEANKKIQQKEESIAAIIKYIKELEHANNVMRGMLQQVKEVAK